MNLCKIETVTIYLCTAPYWQEESKCEYYQAKPNGYCQHRHMMRNAISGYYSVVACDNIKAHTTCAESDQ